MYQEKLQELGENIEIFLLMDKNNMHFILNLSTHTQT